MRLSSVREGRLDDRLTRYLLGALPEADTEQLDELSVVDDDLADRLRVAETDLIDAYVRGTLCGERLERFESHYLASPKRRARVEFAKKFIRAVDAASGAEGTAPSRGSHARPARNRLGRWLLAAAAVLTVITGALLVRNQQLSQDVQRAGAQAAAANRRADSLNDQLTQQRTAAETAQHALTEARAMAENAYALVLLPETRGTGPVPLVAVRPDAAVLTLDLRIDTTASASYDVALKNPATDRILWRDRVAPAPGSRPPTLVAVRIPGRFLKAQHYALDLFDAPHGAPGVFVAGYAFEVVRR